MVSVSSAAFERLPARPPTPPKDTTTAVNEALEFLEVDYALEKPLSDVPRDGVPAVDTTPTQTPPSSLQTGSGKKGVKKVEFSPWTVAVGLSPKKNDGSSPVFRRIHSNRDVRPPKSILKSTLGGPPLTPDENGSPAPGYFSLDEPGGFLKMLESVMQHLANPSPALRLDGYRTLNGALKTYDNLPEAKAIRERMGMLQQHIRRDLSASGKAGSTMDTNLTTQALRLAVALLSPQLSPALTDDFKTMLVDRSIEVLSQEKPVKAVANLYMYLLGYQKWGAHIITTPKAEKLVNSLITIQEKISGNSVVGLRLVIYQKLLDQAPSVMLSSIGGWLKDVFNGLLSSIEEVRKRAIECGLQAGIILGTNSLATKALLELLNTSTDYEGATYGDYLMVRMTESITKKEDGPSVGQIWGVVVLFFRSKKRTLTGWGMLKPWLLIIQKCLNSSDIQTKFQAFVAWNRLVFVVEPDATKAKSMEGMIPMLKVPFIAAFDKKGRDKHSKDAREIALFGYCNLLHYALRPSQSFEDLDLCWDEYVVPIISKLLKSGGRDSMLGCRILKALFNSKTTVWNPNAANENSRMIPEDLPMLNRQWIRSRTQKIISLIEPYLSAILRLPVEDCVKQSPWLELLTAIVEAGRQEVRASVEFKDALASLVNLFGRLWSSASQTALEEASQTWILRYGDLVLSAIDEFGPLHFTEDFLTRNKSEAFEVAPTPSSRSSKHHEALESPAAYLLSLFYRPPPSLVVDESYFDTAHKLIQAVAASKSSRKTRLDLLRHISHRTRLDSTAQSAPAIVAANVWARIAEQTELTFTDDTLTDTDQGSQRLGPCIRDAVTVLMAGFQYAEVPEQAPLDAGLALYSTLLKTLKQAAGTGAVVLGLVEPVAQELCRSQASIPSRSLTRYTIGILRGCEWPRNRQQMDEGRKALWGSTLPAPKHAIFDPFDHLYQLNVAALSKAYNNIGECLEYCTPLIEANITFAESCPASLLAIALRRMQDGLVLWVQDEHRLLATKGKAEQDLAAQVLVLCQCILRRVTSSLRKDNTLLKALDHLFAASFRSSRRSVVNAAVIMWNESFGTQESVEYPPNLEAALRRLIPIVELELPAFPEGSTDESDVPTFADTQDEAADVTPVPSATKPVGSKRMSATRSNRKSAAFEKLVELRPSASPTPSRRARRSPKQSTPRTRLRHDDSQIQFTAIESSPLRNDDDESQVLTEHQQDVASRQRFETALQYPDFSSSPVPKASASKSRIPLLDFSARKPVVEEDFATPTLQNDEQDPMDGYLGSSPTPKASEKNQQRPEIPEDHIMSDVEPDQADLLVEQDIPSSPPEAAEDVEDAMPDAEKNDPTDEPADALASDEEEASRLEEGNTTIGTTFVKPSPQKVVGNNKVHNLRRSSRNSQNQNAPNMPSPQAQNNDALEAAANGPISQEDLSSSPVHFSDSFEEQSGAAEEAVQETTHGVENDEVEAGVEASRVEDSLVADNETSNPTGSPPKELTSVQDDGQKSEDSHRKRRRSSGSVSGSAPKRQKSTSPLKRIFSFSRFMGGSQAEDENEEGVEDCIVVASQQDEDDIDEEEETPAPQPKNSEPVILSQTPTPSQTRRGRGRPRKSATPQTTSPATRTQPRRLKRRASALSNSTHEEEQLETQLVKDTPAPSKARKRRRGHDGEPAPADSHADSQASRSSQAVAVLIPAASINKEEYEDHYDSSDARHASQQLQSEQEAAAAARRIGERKIAKPKSILQRLKDVLKDLGEMVLGSQEEREIHDVLFHINKEAHEAERRGKT